MAPEVLMVALGYSYLPYSKKADIWSFGAMLFWLIKGGVPFTFNDDKKQWIYFEREIRSLPSRIS